jgi:hypothetical protein
MPELRAFILLLGASGAGAWVTITQRISGVPLSDIKQAQRGTGPSVTSGDYGKTLGYLWHYPDDPSSDRGLGGGITWAWDPELCGKLLPKFGERYAMGAEFVSCKYLRAAMHRSFNEWSSNHAKISFVDVTEECEKMGTLNSVDRCGVGRESDWTLSSDGTYEYKSYIQSSLTPEQGGLAEVWVTALADDYESSPRWVSSGRRLELAAAGAFDDHFNKTASDFPQPNPAIVVPSRFRTLNADTPPSPPNPSPPPPSSPCVDEECSQGPFDNLLSGDGVAALAQCQPLAVNDFRYTNGLSPVQKLSNGNEYPRYVWETYEATVLFNVSKCWYLDSTFCAPFHKFKANVGNASDAQLIGNLVAWGIWTVALIAELYSIGSALYAFRKQRKANKDEDWVEEELEDDEDEDTKRMCFGLFAESKTAIVFFQGVHRVIAVIAEQSLAWATLRLVFLIAPPVFMINIFNPCWSCFDFEGAATHEVGHVLGLDHPDSNITNNVDHTLMTAARINSSNCLYPWDDVTELQMNTEDSIMKTFTQNNPQVCIENDDLEGLAVLYPDCTHSISSRACFKIPHTIGWLRLMLYVFMPICIILILLVLAGSYMQGFEKEKFEDAKALAIEEHKRAKKLQLKSWVLQIENKSNKNNKVSPAPQAGKKPARKARKAPAAGATSSTAPKTTPPPAQQMANLE